MNRFSTRTTEQLIRDYLFEKDRENKQDAKMTQNNIKAELKRRYELLLRFLDDEFTTEKHTRGIYDRFING